MTTRVNDMASHVGHREALSFNICVQFTYQFLTHETINVNPYMVLCPVLIWRCVQSLHGAVSSPYMALCPVLIWRCVQSLYGAVSSPYMALCPVLSVYKSLFRTWLIQLHLDFSGKHSAMQQLMCNIPKAQQNASSGH